MGGREKWYLMGLQLRVGHLPASLLTKLILTYDKMVFDFVPLHCVAKLVEFWDEKSNKTIVVECGKGIPGYEQASRLSGKQVLPRWFSTGISNGSSAQKEGATTKVTAFSPLEASIAKPRSGPLTAESWKVKRTELLTQATYYMIPTLLLVSKNSISTSLLVASVFHQVYMFYKEILLDYVHHDITRKWVLIYFKILLIIMAKETIVNFDLF
uniref:Uncharacterized protein n=1 Tax=Oryza brachyantha TaxID=4533 RepID=J3L7L6_ORYBR